MIDPILEDKIVLITGGNHGIGAATARAFAAQKAKVFITYYRLPSPLPDKELQSAIQAGLGGPALYAARQQQPVEPLLDEITSLGGTCAALEMDLSGAQNIPVVFDRCEETLGNVDVLVNNHTHCVLETFDPERVKNEGFPIQLTNAKSIDQHFAVNARAYALMMREYVQRYLRHGSQHGRIVNLSTDAAHAHVANVSYAASKHAIESYSRSAALELGKYGITVNIVAPGPIQTGYITLQDVDSIAQATPLGSVGKPEDIADVIVFLASNQARWITGQLLVVGGGWRTGQ